jgi:UDP-glucose 4-epimerase
MQGVNAVIHLAALLHIVNPPPEMREKYERINVGGTAMVVEAAIKVGVKRVVLSSLDELPQLWNVLTNLPLGG